MRNHKKPARKVKAPKGVKILVKGKLVTYPAWVVRVNHHTMPIRRIAKVEKQNGLWFTVLECKHSAPGLPEGGRFARYYPCPVCHKQVLAAVRAYKAQKPTAMQEFRRNLRRKLTGGTH